MNKISFSPIVILFTLCILVGCARSTDTNTSTSTSKGASTSTSMGMPIQKPISTGSQSLPNPTKVATDGTKIPTQQEKIFWLRTLWESKSQVIDSFYDPKNKKLIDAWINDKNNRSQSARGDILEFLSYCEELNLIKGDKKKNINIFTRYDLQNLENYIAINTGIILYAQSNKNLSQSATSYWTPWITTNVVRQFFKENSGKKLLLIDDAAPYALAYNEIYAFLKWEIPVWEFWKSMDDVMSLNHDSSKLYSWLYKEYYLWNLSIKCSDILNKYRKQDKSLNNE